MAKKIGLLIAFCLSQLCIQCSSDDNKSIEEKVITEQETNEITLLRNYIAESLHIDIIKVIYDADKSIFIIDRDILMPLEHAIGNFNRSNSIITNKKNQMGGVYMIKPEMAKSIKVYISPDVPAVWKNSINQAIKNWNSINTSINLAIVDSPTSANTTIVMYEEPLGVIATAYMPYDGKPGESIKINSKYNNLIESKKVCTITHEFGHTFGLDHTNSDNRRIECTPILDDDSVMTTPVFEFVKLSPYDIIAISQLYPVAAGTKKLYRYKKKQYYFYTTDPCEIIPGKDGYVLDGDSGYLYLTQVDGTVPLYRSLNGPSIKDHKLSIAQTSTSDVIIGYLYSTQQPGTTALYSSIASYEYFPSNKHYLYTTIFNKDEVIMSPMGYVPNKIIQNYNPNDIIF